VRENLSLGRQLEAVSVERPVEVLLGEGKMSVVKVYRTFMHREPDKTLTVKRPNGWPEELALLGKLTEIQGAGVKFRWPRSSGAMLLCSAAGKLYCYAPGGMLSSLAYVDSINYCCDKGEGKLEYTHSFGSPRPRLVADFTGNYARLVGGSYEIREEGIWN